MRDHGIKQLLREAEAAGCSVIRRKAGHVRIERDGVVAFIASTPSCSRAAKNARALLKRLGLLPR